MLLAPGLFVLASFQLTHWLRHPVPPAWSPNVVDATSVSGIRWQELTPTLEVPGLNAACELREQEVRVALGDGFSTWTASPFVLAGDIEADALQRIYRRTILPASQAMNSEYFSRTPTEPITLLLFSRAETYEATAERLFGDRHVSVYGYYRPRERMVLVNLATGSGTLVHELTHALMHFDYPNAPAWLQEGLASLHEHGEYVTEAGQWVLRGRVNWRLHDLPDSNLDQWRLGELLARGDLRGDDEASWYALARYLCLFLQDRHALANVYRDMRERDRGIPNDFVEDDWIALPHRPDDVMSDHQGEETLDSDEIEPLLQAFGANDIDTIELRFRNWVDQLSVRRQTRPTVSARMAHWF